MSTSTITSTAAEFAAEFPAVTRSESESVIRKSDAPKQQGRDAQRENALLRQNTQRILAEKPDAEPMDVIKESVYCTEVQLGAKQFIQAVRESVPTAAPAAAQKPLPTASGAQPQRQAQAAPASAPKTGLKQIAMSQAEAEFRTRFIQTLRKELAAKQAKEGLDAKLDLAERITVWMHMKQAENACPSSKYACLIGTLASYHGWPVSMVALTDHCSKYAYNQGLKKDRVYREIDPEIQAWIYAK